VAALLAQRLADPAPAVRVAALRALARFPEQRARIRSLGADPDLAVRLSAWWATRSTLPSPTPPEFLTWLDVNADQPAGAIRQSEWAIVQQRPEEAIRWAERAVRWDPSLPSYHTLARALTAAGRRDEAEKLLKDAREAERPPR
jgi:predicted Zn-dependent protease